MMTAEDTKAALRTFDEYVHLIKLVEPHCIQETLQTANIFPNNEPFADATTLPSSTLMERFLNGIRSCIECNGAQKFLAFVDVLQTEGRYAVLGCHIFSKCSYINGLQHPCKNEKLRLNKLSLSFLV